MTRPRPTATQAPTPLPGASDRGADFDPCSPDAPDAPDTDSHGDAAAERTISHRTPMETAEYVRLKKRGLARVAPEASAQRDPGESDD